MELKKEKELHPLQSRSSSITITPSKGNDCSRALRHHLTYTMIRKNELFCKLILIKKSSKQLYAQAMAEFRPETEQCTSCSARGSCIVHEYYERNLIDFIAGKPVYHKIKVCRLICNSCGCTHAVLPDVIIPYSTYGIFFILRVLAEYYSGRYTVEKLCCRFYISHSTLYRWRDLFQEHKEIWLGVLASDETSAFLFMKILLRWNHFADFTSAFIAKVKKSFLQKHVNGQRIIITT